MSIDYLEKLINLRLEFKVPIKCQFTAVHLLNEAISSCVYRETIVGTSMKIIITFFIIFKGFLSLTHWI